MKKTLALLAAVTMALSMTACSSKKTERDWDWESEPAAASTGVTLNVYNWGEYIDNEDMEVNKAFEHMTGIKVNYQTFDSNESMYTLIKAGAADYDVVFPSDYMVGKMKDEGMLAKLNFDNIPNYKYIDDQYKILSYDPTNEYSVPYTWGTVGIFYNKKYVDEADLKQGWDILWNEKYSGKIFMFDNQRDAFGIALKKLGYSMNTTNKDEWQAAYEELVKQKPLVQGYFMDPVYDKMIAEEGWLAPYYSGDGSIMIYGEDGNEDIDFFVPDQGTNLFVDAMCVLQSSQHKTEAEQYINFLCRTEIAKANAEYLGYSTPHTEARKQLDPEVANNPVFYPAKEVLDNANATESDVNVAAKTLENTKNALVLKDMRGDIDDNGKVTAADALLALKAATNTITLTDAQQKRADVDGQEGVSVIDALMILENAAGKIALNPSDDLTPVVTPDPIPADLPTATKAQLKAVMDKAVDLDRYTADSVKTYTGTMAACNAVYANADASGENIYRALNALQVAIDGLQEKAQDNWIGDFTKIVGKHTVLGQGQNLLYADWKQLDQTSLDVSEDRDHLFLQMTIVLQSTNPNVDPAKMWSGLTVKLRSADKGGVAGDPEMEKGNTEHNYGWNFSPSNFDGSSTLTVSIPLNKANTNKKGVMDWTDVQRLIVQCQLNGNCTGDMYQYTMLIKSAHIVDGTPLKEAADTLAATITKAGTSGGDALTAAKATLQTAQDMLAGKNALVNLYDLKKANTDLLAAIG